MKKLRLFAVGIMTMIAIVAFISGSAFADIVIKNGSTMMVSGLTSVVVTADVTIETGGTLTNSGTVSLTGDFTNGGTADLGTGEVVFNGTATQNILGSTPSEFEDLTVNNGNGVDLGVAALVGGTMEFTSGVFDIGGNNLTFGVAASASATTSFSATAMIQADGTGQVLKAFPAGTSDPAAFFFPLGSVGEYSPIQLDFNSSTFGAAATAGFNVTASKEPDNVSLDNYLERYWTLVNTDITAGYTYDLTGTYVDADIVVAGGYTEADISGALYDGAGWLIGDPVNTGANTFLLDDFNDDGNVTGVEFRILSDLKVICQGAYRDVLNEMITDLNPHMPLDAATAYAHIGYTGTESVAAIPSADVVDWVLVEVRDATDAASATSATIAGTVAGFLMKDGSIVGLDGVSPLPFKTLITNNAYFVIIQRNHLAVMTSSSPTESFNNYTYDFTDAVTKAYGTGSLTLVDTGPNKFALYAGETNNSGIITYADKQPIDNEINQSGYRLADTNFSGIVTYADKQYIDNNINKSGQIP